MKNVIETIDVKSYDSLYRVATALGEITLMRRLGSEAGQKEPKPIKQSMDAIMDVLVYKFQQLFMDEFPKYANNKMAVGENDDGITVTVFDELLEEDCCDECSNILYEDGTCKYCRDSVDLESILKDSGLETSDDYVERLANDIKNKRGGLA